MPLEVAKKFIDLLLDNDENTRSYLDTRCTRGVILDFIGGEPFLETALIDQIIDYFEEQTIIKDHPWQYHHKYSFSTNGTLYFKPEVQQFLNKHKNNISLSISLDGNKRLHDACRVFPDGSGSYDLAIAAVHHYREVFDQTVGSKLTISPQNVNYLAEAIINLIEEGYTDINFNCIYEEGWTYEHATILYYQLKEIANYVIANDLYDDIDLSMFNDQYYKPKQITDTQNWCGGNGRMIAVDYNGDIFPCVRYMSSSLGDDVPPVIIGNVNDGIAPNAICKACIEKLKSIDRLTQSTQECIECSVAEGCSWCQAYNYQVYKDFDHRCTFICPMHQAAALATCYLYNFRYRDRNEKKRMKLWLEDSRALKIIPQEELNLLKSLQYPIR